MTTRYCSSCSRKLDSDESYAVNPRRPDDVTCLSCAIDSGCLECGEGVDLEVGAIHPGCAPRPSCTFCSLPIDADEAATHDGCLTPKTSSTTEETRDATPTADPA